MTTLRRTIHPEVRVIDGQKGVADYIASDQTLDSYHEVIRADGWRFNRFQKNAPFVNTHRYDSIEDVLGKVTDYRVEGKQLIERVQWAIDVEENKLAQLGWKMTAAGYLKAVSVGFQPTKVLTPYSPDQKGWKWQLNDLGLTAEQAPRAIYVEQEQLELSTCVVGINPNAVARAYKAGAITDAELDTFSSELARHVPASPATDPADAALAFRQARQREFLDALRKIIKTI